jgi:hypothetical protein
MRCGRCDQTLTFSLTTPLPGDTTWSLDFASKKPPTCKDTSVTGGPYGYDSYSYDSYSYSYGSYSYGDYSYGDYEEGTIVTFNYTQTIAEYLCAGQEYTFEIEYGLGFYELLLNGVHLHDGTASVTGENVTFVVPGHPSMSPTTGPTVSPSGAPTTQPSTGSPSTSPTIAPTASPTVSCGPCTQKMEIEIETGDDVQDIFWSLQLSEDAPDSCVPLDTDSTGLVYNLTNNMYDDVISVNICTGQEYKFKVVLNDGTYRLDLNNET